MKRTQIYLEENLYQDLKVGANLSRVTVSEYIRRLLNNELYSPKKLRNTVVSSKKSLSLIAQKAASFAQKDLARNFDIYLEKSLK